MKIQDEKITVQVVPMLPGLEDVDEILPKQSNAFIPDWWKVLPRLESEKKILGDFGGNVKECPSFPSFFSQGFIIPMWCDVLLYYEEDTGNWAWRVPDSRFVWTNHTNEQFLNNVPFQFLDNRALHVFKPLCPWQIITPPGWSVLQLPLFYHFENEWTVLPGIVDTDYHHEVNQQVLLFKNKKEVFIKRGTPFVQYIPFQRQKLTISVEKEEGEIAKKLNYSRTMMNTKFMGDRRYLRLRKAPYYDKEKRDE